MKLTEAELLATILALSRQINENNSNTGMWNDAKSALKKFKAEFEEYKRRK